MMDTFAKAKDYGLVQQIMNELYTLVRKQNTPRLLNIHNEYVVICGHSRLIINKKKSMVMVGIQR